MNFLQRLDSSQIKAIYHNLDGDGDEERAVKLNARLNELQLPMQVANLSSIFTVRYTQASRYNWMLQFYLRAQGLALSWVGTGRFIFSLNYSDADFDAVDCHASFAAAQAMQCDGWWWNDPQLTNKAIKRKVLKEFTANKIGIENCLNCLLTAVALSSNTKKGEYHSPR